MDLRGVLVALIVAATAAFVVGVALERGRGSGHRERGASKASSERGERQSESGEAQPEEVDVAERGSAEPREELRPLGVDVEAWPFVALAAVASLALAAAAFARPRAVALLALVAAAMLVFAALDVREVVHQVDEDAGGLALLAATVAALHLAAAAVAGIMRA
jgi:hypothetical protein